MLPAGAEAAGSGAHGLDGGGEPFGDKEGGEAFDWLTTRSLSRLLWAYAEADGVSPMCARTRALLPAMGARLLPQLPTLDDVEIAQMAASLAAVDAPAEQRAQLFAELAREARPRLRRFRPQALSLLARAFASARVHDELLLNAIAEAARGQLGRRFASVDLAQLVWAVATVRADARCACGFPHSDELLHEAHTALAARVAGSPRALDSLGQREAAQLVWAFGAEGLLAEGALTSCLLAAVMTPAAERGGSATRNSLFHLEVRVADGVEGEPISDK
ncbi:hypothetical protein T492DRAFT_364141 [Pavlovales sp. CCMP2436]|nr:hypothetical protein T492DRAFT_364141 [Pavlovales sp. CCMP2436]